MATEHYTFDTKEGFQIDYDIKEISDEKGVFGYEIEVFKDGQLYLYRQCCTPEQVRAVIEDLQFEGI